MMKNAANGFDGKSTKIGGKIVKFILQLHRLYDIILR